MFTDAKWKLAEDQTGIQMAGAGAISQNIVDQGSFRDVAKGRVLYAVFTVKETFVGANAFVEWGIIIGSGNGIGAFNTTNLLADSLYRVARSHNFLVEAGATNALVAGAQFTLALSPITARAVTAFGVDSGSPETGRSGVAGYFIVSSVNTTAGMFDLDITLDPPSGRTTYQIGFGISNATS